MKCPHCNNEFEAPTAAYTNAECYGGGRYHVVSRCCGKAVYIYAQRRVVIDVIGKGNETETECWR